MAYELTNKGYTTASDLVRRQTLEEFPTSSDENELLDLLLNVEYGEGVPSQAWISPSTIKFAKEAGFIRKAGITVKQRQESRKREKRDGFLAWAKDKGNQPDWLRKVEERGKQYKESM